MIETVDRLISRLQALDDGWREAGKEMPEEGSFVLTNLDGEYQLALFERGCWGLVNVDRSINYERGHCVTHWCPLPAPPRAKNEKQEAPSSSKESDAHHSR